MNRTGGSRKNRPSACLYGRKQTIYPPACQFCTGCVHQELHSLRQQQPAADMLLRVAVRLKSKALVEDT